MKTQGALLISMLTLASGLGCGGRASNDAGSSSAGSASAGSSSASNAGTNTNAGSSSTNIGGSDTRGSGGSGGIITPASCEPTTEEAGSSSTDNARVPLGHRASPCSFSQRGPGPTPQPYSANDAARSADGGVSCSMDSQCEAGVNGRCFPFEGLVGPGGCSYDDCITDSECPSGQPCVGRSTPSDNSANQCAPAGNCAVDSDCGPAGYCSPSEELSADGECGPYRYFCHTSQDTCIDGGDCLTNDGSPRDSDATCVYDLQARHWACTDITCALP